MGMFDNPTPFRDSFAEGEVFMLEAAKLGAPIKTDYGETAPALLKIGGKWFSLFGQGIVSQIERMEAGDLPARVAVQRGETRSGRSVKLLVPEGVSPEQMAATALPEVAYTRGKGDDHDDIPF